MNRQPMNAREMRRHDLKKQWEWTRRCLVIPLPLEMSAETRARMNVEFVNLSRRCRKLNIAQWEIAVRLAPEWHGTPDDLLIAAKELT